LDKKVEIVWSKSALLMLAELHEYLNKDSISLADKYLRELQLSLDKLENHPEACAKCRNEKLAEKKYRCCNFKNHFVVYLFLDNVVSILAVIHASRSSNTIEKILE